MTHDNDNNNDQPDTSEERQTDEQALKDFMDLLENRITITTGFTQDNETGILTHQYLQLQCGEHTVISQPEPLDTPLRIATGAEIGQTVN